MSPVPPSLLARIVKEALLEDLGPGDLTTSALVAPGTLASGRIRAGEPLVVAGIEAARLAFQRLDPAVRFNASAKPGDARDAGETILEVTGEAAGLLSAERTALNFLGRLSGIATGTRRCVRAVEGTGAAIYDTRKTTPGLRLLERQAVSLGGGRNHRFGLFDAVLIKDNHLALAGGVGPAVESARLRLGATAVIEVEVETLEDLEAAIAAGASVVLLDNMTPRQAAEAVRLAAGRVTLEASGGITPDDVAAFARAGVERISMGWLTHSAPAARVGMEVTPA